MRIGIITHLTTDKSAGIGTYVSSLIKHLQLIDKENEYIVFTFSGNCQLFNLTNANFKEIRTRGFGRRVKMRNFFRLKYFFWSKFVLPHWCRKLQLDVVHIPSTWFVDKIANTRQVITIHDLAEFYTNRYNAVMAYIKQQMVNSAMKQSDALITVSNFSAKEINNIYTTDNKKINVIYNGISDSEEDVKNINVEEIFKKFNVVNKRYFVFIGTMQKHKNIPIMLRAFKLVVYEFPEVKFLLAGRLDNGYNEIRNVINELELHKNVILSNYITSDEKTILMQNAIAFVFVSQYEGFGFPVLEAQNVRVPIIISNSSSLPEIAGMGALSVPHDNIEEITKAMKRCIADKELVKRLADAGEKNLTRFSWSNAAEQTSLIYRYVNS